MKTIFSLTLSAIILTACTTTTFETANNYTNQTAMTSQSVDRCRVIDTQIVRTGAQSISGRNTLAEQNPSIQVGTLIGGIIGVALAKELDDDTLVQTLGGLGGAIAGSNVAARIERTSVKHLAIEYSVIDRNGREQVIVQPWAEGDRTVAVGQTCRLVRSQSGVRVLPGEHLPSQIDAPNTTRIRS